MIDAADTRTNRGWRNRIILEILYDTAIRRSELAGLKINDMDLNAGYIHVRGKGDKERVVPLSSAACAVLWRTIPFDGPSCHFIARQRHRPPDLEPLGPSDGTGRRMESGQTMCGTIRHPKERIDAHLPPHLRNPHA